MTRLTNFLTIAVATIIVMLSSCNNKRNPGRIYMPDMTYSRAVETYSLHDSSFWTTDANGKGGNQIYYNSIPVAGTVKRGELYPYTLTNDSNGYKMSAAVKNPIDSVSKMDMVEAARLFNINCGICHGEKGTANGPLSTAGHIGAVANLTLPLYLAMADGTMFHSITYGKNNMGSYASQLDRHQRWMMVKYIRSLQGLPVKGLGGATAPIVKDSTVAAGTATAVKDSTKTK